MSDAFEPRGVRFFDARSGREWIDAFLMRRFGTSRPDALRAWEEIAIRVEGWGNE